MMKHFYRLGLLLAATFLFSTSTAFGQDTFSIVAVDTVTGEVGSAGASCIQNCIIISDIHPGIGAVHTQASWISDNQDIASLLMENGHTPQEIIDSMVVLDAQGTPAVRQYGVVTLKGPIHAAGYTGDGCMDYKGHIVGPYYSIQGNILLGRIVLEQMEHNFLTTPGPLADRLMAAMQGANMPGADTRCLQDGTSSKSSFIRVARPADDIDYYLDIIIPAVPKGIEPIDTLQKRFNAWKASASVTKTNPTSIRVSIQPNPMRDVAEVRVTGLNADERATLFLFNTLGSPVSTIPLTQTGNSQLQRNALRSGVYFYRVLGANSDLLATGELVVE